MEEIEKLDEEEYGIDERVETDLSWTCKDCGKTNTEYDIPYEKEIICTCYNCGKKIFSLVLPILKQT